MKKGDGTRAMQIKSRLSIVDWLSLVNCWRFFCVSLRRGLTPHSMAMKSDEIMGKRIKNGDRLWDGMVVPNHHFTQSNWDRSEKMDYEITDIHTDRGAEMPKNCGHCLSCSLFLGRSWHETMRADSSLLDY